MRKGLLTALVFAVLLFGKTVYAAVSISSSALVDGNNIIVQGVLNGATEPQNVSILLEDLNNLIYVNQTKSNDDGSFVFEFQMADNMPTRQYSYRIGAEEGLYIHIGSFNYFNPEAPGPMKASHTVEGRNITISGNLPGATRVHNISLIVEKNGISVLEKTATTNTNGTFTIDFNIAENFRFGEFSYTLQSDTNHDDFVGSFELIEIQNTNVYNIVDVDVDVSLDSYDIVISGNLVCGKGKKVAYRIVDITDNQMYRDETIESTDGNHHISLYLPSLLTPRQYEITISVFDGDATIAEIIISVDSSILLVTASVNATVSDNVCLYVDAQSGNKVVDGSIQIFEPRNFTITVPNLFANGTVNFKVRGTEQKIEPIKTVYSMIGNSGQESMLIAYADGMTNIADKIFTLTYDETKLELIDFVAQSGKAITNTGVYGRVEIVSFSPGVITFKLNGISLPNNKSWTGILNIFKFRIKDNLVHSTDIQIN